MRDYHANDSIASALDAPSLSSRAFDIFTTLERAVDLSDRIGDRLFGSTTKGISAASDYPPEAPVSVCLDRIEGELKALHAALTRLNQGV